MKIQIPSPLSAFSLGALCCALLLSTHAVQADTLQDIYQQALQNDHRFRAAQADRDAGLENRTLGRSALLPQIGASASWNRSEIDAKLPAEEDYGTRQINYGIGLTQSLVNISNWHNHARGKALADVAEAQFALAEQELILRTANAYFSALQAVDNLTTAKSEEEALSQQLEQTKQRFAVGLTAITEVHEAQAAYDSATANRLVAEGGLGIAFEGLEVLTGQRHHALSPLRDAFPVESPQPLDRDAWVELALENNASLRARSHAARSAEANAKAQQAAHLPTLSGSLNYGNNELARDSRRIQEQSAASVQLDLSVPLYSGGGVSASRRQSYNQFLSARELYLQAQRDVVQATRSSHLGVLTSAATVKARQQAITSNRSALEATQAGYDVGTRDLVDVLNAQRNLFRAQRDYYDALYNYILAGLQLRQASGVLSGEDVTDLNRWLDVSRKVQYNP